MKFVGPVFWYDLVRIARRQRLALWRAAYGLALLVALFLLYTSDFPHTWLGSVRVKPADAAAFATRFFAVFTLVQFAAVILLTPALTANALGEEKGKNTLTFLLTTHLSSREIVLGKLLTRLLQVGLLVLTGMPVLGLLQIMGGVEPALVLACFAALALTGLSLGGLGLACAVLVKKPQNAAWRAYQVVLLYAALSALSIWYWELPYVSRAATGLTWLATVALPNPPATVTTSVAAPGTTWVTTVAPQNVGVVSGRIMTGTFTFTVNPQSPTTAETILEAFNSGNPYFAFLRLKHEQEAGTLLTDALPAVLRDYAIGHAAFALLFVGLAVWRLRASAAKQGTGLTYKKALVLKPAPHPPIKDRPVLWKELHCEAKPRQRWLALFFSRWFFVASFLPAWVFLVLVLDQGFERLSDWTLSVLRYGGTLVTVGLCLRVALHAARSIGQERDRQTLDTLLTTDLTPDEIVRDKWWGSYLSGRWVFVWLLIHWGLGAMALALDPLGIPLLLAECLVYAAFFVSLGMYCAARWPTTKQAAATALVVGLLGTTLIPWAGGQVLMVALPEKLWETDSHRRGYSDPSMYFGRVERPWPEDLAAGLTPPWTLFESCFPNHLLWSPYYYERHSRIEDLWPWVLLGLLVYALAALVLARRAEARFRRSAGRCGSALAKPRAARLSASPP
jgi:ABC-type transport system involved in multi-copper enzyme maturation permease subunit